MVVAGGTGFLGSRLVPALAAAGHEVVVLTRGRREDTEHARFVQWHPAGDLGERRPWHDALSDAAAVINLCGASAAARRWSTRRKQELVESRVLPSRALVAAANGLEHPPAAILQASGVNYYGTGEAQRDESAPAGSDFLAHLASAWEAPLEETLIRTVTLRFGAVLDDRSGALPQMLLPFRLFAGGPVAGGHQWLSWIHVRDAVRAILFLMDSPLADAVNVTSPQPIRNGDFARTAGRVLHRPAFLPMPRIVISAVLGEGATMVCDGVQAFPGEARARRLRLPLPRDRGSVEEPGGVARFRYPIRHGSERLLPASAEAPFRHVDAAVARIGLVVHEAGQAIDELGGDAHRPDQVVGVGTVALQGDRR